MSILSVCGSWASCLLRYLRFAVQMDISVWQKHETVANRHVSWAQHTPRTLVRPQLCRGPSSGSSPLAGFEGIFTTGKEVTKREGIKVQGEGVISWIINISASHWRGGIGRRGKGKENAWYCWQVVSIRDSATHSSITRTVLSYWERAPGA